MRKFLYLIEILVVIVLGYFIFKYTTVTEFKENTNINNEVYKSSVRIYIDNINESIILKEIEGLKITDSTYSTEEIKQFNLQIRGEQPIDGWVKIEKSKVVDYSLKYDNVVINYIDNNTMEVIKDGKIKSID